MKSASFRTALLALTWSFVGTAMSAQTVEEVRQVVENYFGTDDEAGAARKRLVEWGNAALPPLKLLAGEPQPLSSWNLVCSIGEVGTTESLDLLVSILDGKTKVPPDGALNYLAPRVSHPEDPRLTDLLQANPRFKPAIRALGGSDDWLQRKLVAEVAGAMNWPDFVPLLQGMLADENAQLRKAAAAALSTLTGRPVDEKTPQATFTDVQLIPALVSEPTRIESRPNWELTGAFLLPRPDGPSTLMLGDGQTFRAWPGMDDTEMRTFSVPALDVLLLRAGGLQPQYVTLAVESGFRGAGADEAISWSEDGSELWRYVPPTRGVEAGAILADAEGPYGVALGPGGETGIVGIDPRGKPLWSVPRVHVLYDLQTHPRLPGVMLVVHGEISLVHHSRDEIDGGEVTGAFMRSVRRGGEQLYAHNGLLYPGADGAPEIVVSAMASHSEPVLACFDASYMRKWQISLSHRVTQLAQMELAGRERLFVVTTDGGELLLVNALGVLRWRGLLPASEENGGAFVFELVAGNAGGQVVIALSCPQGFFIYSVRAELLPLATR